MLMMREKMIDVWGTLKKRGNQPARDLNKRKINLATIWC